MFLNLLLITVLIICIVTDLKSRKIYNKVIFPALLLALLLNTVEFGLAGLGSSVVGFFVGLGILIIPYLMGGMGAGDVKLLALVGAIKGVSFVLITAVYMAIIGGGIGLCILLFRKGFLYRIRTFLFSLITLRLKTGIKPSLGLDNNTLKKTYPYAVAIAGGAFMAFLWNGVVLL
ncbi:prepilin peptidase CpaA [Evansella vedderi]|uniref:Prepilin peptidase CpaA n=1 Tax=Evansella vedderi TaxID=38282 RepID=A0ABU0A0I0_9BACI|nr:prepilin peptidase [Evansella vedderi]MDQ0256987.1 prepilin peptidase CpaA [Evansella vedderi]